MNPTMTRRAAAVLTWNDSSGMCSHDGTVWCKHKMKAISNGEDDPVEPHRTVIVPVAAPGQDKPSEVAMRMVSDDVLLSNPDVYRVEVSDGFAWNHVGVTPAGVGRRALREMALPFLFEWGMQHTCDACGGSCAADDRMVVACFGASILREDRYCMFCKGKGGGDDDLVPEM